MRVHAAPAARRVAVSGRVCAHWPAVRLRGDCHDDNASAAGQWRIDRTGVSLIWRDVHKQAARHVRSVRAIRRRRLEPEVEITDVARAALPAAHSACRSATAAAHPEQPVAGHGRTGHFRRPRCAAAAGWCAAIGNRAAMGDAAAGDQRRGRAGQCRPCRRRAWKSVRPESRRRPPTRAYGSDRRILVGGRKRGLVAPRVYGGRQAQCDREGA